MLLAIIGAVLLVAGAVAVVTGTLPLADLAALIDRVAPILLFVVAMSVVTELASEAGVFLWTARRRRICSLRCSFHSQEPAPRDYFRDSGPVSVRLCVAAGLIKGMKAISATSWVAMVKMMRPVREAE